MDTILFDDAELLFRKLMRDLEKKPNLPEYKQILQIQASNISESEKRKKISQIFNKISLRMTLGFY